MKMTVQQLKDFEEARKVAAYEMLAPAAGSDSNVPDASAAVPFGDADFSGAEEPTRPACPHPSVRPEERHYDATCGSRFSVKQTNVVAIMHQLHQLLDDSFHAVDAGLLPAGCRITIIVEP